LVCRVCAREERQKFISQAVVPVQQFLQVWNATGGGDMRIATKDFLHGKAVSPWPKGAARISQVAKQDFGQRFGANDRIWTFIGHEFSRLVGST
jgi:hypothetical protein